MAFSLPNGRLTNVIIAAAAFAFLVAPNAAKAGFFEQLFGAPPAPPAPTYNYESAAAPTVEPLRPHVSRADMNMPFAHRSTRRTHLAAQPKLDTKPVLQKTTSLMSDKTLHAGDAVMMRDGIHVYDGGESAKHSLRQFVALNEAHDLPSTERSALVAMDTRTDPLRGAVAPDTIASGRSAAVGTPVVSGFRITDARGQSVRYVGP